jgi:hypothetical protein
MQIMQNKELLPMSIDRRKFFRISAGTIAFLSVTNRIHRLLADAEKNSQESSDPSPEVIKKAIEKIREATVCIDLKTGGEEQWTLGRHSGVAVDLSIEKDLVDPDYDKKYLLIATCLHGVKGVRDTLKARGNHDLARKQLYAWIRSKDHDFRPNKIIVDKNRVRTDTMLLQIPRESLPDRYEIIGINIHNATKNSEIAKDAFVVSGGTKELEFINHIDLGHVVSTKVMPQGGDFSGPEIGYKLLKENKFIGNGEDFKMESGQSGGPVAMLTKEGILTLIALQSSTVTTTIEGQPSHTLSYGSSFTNVRRILEDENILKKE